MGSLQTTLKSAVEFRGIGIHIGKETTVRFKPAPADTGIIFIRTDVDGNPQIEATVENVRQVEEQSRRTTLGKDYYEVHTVEHVLSALYGLGIDNAYVELDSDEPPEPGDGSVRSYVNLLDSVGVEEIEGKPRRILKIDEQVNIEAFGATLSIVPYNGLKISFTIDFDNPVIGTQYISLDITPEIYRDEIASSRTFCMYEDVKLLQERNMIRGGTLENAIVVGEDGILNDEPLRFSNEFVRHKVLDLLGDLSLLGVQIRGHVISAKSGHASNISFVKKIKKKYRNALLDVSLREKVWDIADIMNLLPHRYPFLLVDKILEVEPGKRIVGIKNVSINEPFFQGHFPGSPIVPGVLLVEALGQAGGLMLFEALEEPKDWLVYFTGLEKVRFRNPVKPGDQVLLELTMEQQRGPMCRMKGIARVDDKVMCEAELKAMLMKKT